MSEFSSAAVDAEINANIALAALEQTQPNVYARLRAEQLIKQGYHQISKKHRLVARLPVDKTGREALAEASGRRDWAYRLSEADATDHYLRVCAKDRVQLDVRVFIEFRVQGGRTAR